MARNACNGCSLSGSFMDYGVMSTGATDYPPGPFEPLMGIQSCVTRTDSEGREWGLNQRISVEDALRIYTLNGAYAGFEENRKGSIEVGKLADLVVLGSGPDRHRPLWHQRHSRWSGRWWAERRCTRARMAQRA